MYVHIYTHNVHTHINDTCTLTCVQCYVYRYIFHTCMHTFMHAYIHTYIHTCIRTYIHDWCFGLLFWKRHRRDWNSCEADVMTADWVYILRLSLPGLETSWHTMQGWFRVSYCWRGRVPACYEARIYVSTSASPPNRVVLNSYALSMVRQYQYSVSWHHDLSSIITFFISFWTLSFHLCLGLLCFFFPSLSSPNSTCFRKQTSSIHPTWQIWFALSLDFLVSISYLWVGYMVPPTHILNST